MNIQKIDTNLVPAGKINIGRYPSEGNYYLKFDNTNPNVITLGIGQQEDRYSIDDLTLRVVEIQPTKTSYTDQSYKYDKDGEESYTCVVLVKAKDQYYYASLLLRKSLNQIAYHVNMQHDKVVEHLKSSNRENLVSHAYLFMPFRPCMKVVKVNAGSYLKITSINWLEPSNKDVEEILQFASESKEQYNKAAMAAANFMG